MKGRDQMSEKKQKGFTIIEVVLVLAIAGLIFLMVFLALPALQSSQRDTSRKNDVGIVLSAVNSYSGNNRGGFPTKATLASYVDPTKNNVSTNTSIITVNTTTGAQTISPATATIVVTQKSVCSTSSAASQILTGGTNSQFTVVTKLESGGGAYYCQNS